MQITEAAELIQPALNYLSVPQTWADLGCGSGTFTQALASLLPPQSNLFAVDKSFHQIDSKAETTIHFIKANFEKDPLPFHDLNGILMANALHFVKDKITVIKKLEKYLTDGGFFIIVEYDTDTGNQWVPYPVSFTELIKLFTTAGYKSIIKTGERDSIYNNTKMYLARISR